MNGCAKSWFGTPRSGARDEGDGSSEIELAIDLGAGSDSLRVAGRSGHNFIVLGSGGLNLNGTEKSPDADVSVANIEHYSLTGGVDKNILWAAGSYGTKTDLRGSRHDRPARRIRHHRGRQRP